jgi:acylphosphatase
MLTQDRLKELLHYCPETGVFTWLNNRGRVKTGEIAGFIKRNANGKKYVQIVIEGNHYYAHRLAVLYVTGSFPTSVVDHGNGNGSDNAYVNLQTVTQLDNSHNQKKHRTNTSGFTGVVWNKKDRRWRAVICSNGKHVYLGQYISKDDAIRTRQAAEVQYGYHPNHGTERPL